MHCPVLVLQVSGEQAALVRHEQAPVLVSHVLAVEPPLQLDAEVHGSHSSVVVLQWFAPQMLRAELVHAG
jgi:hypothetical protein